MVLAPKQNKELLSYYLLIYVYVYLFLSWLAYESGFNKFIRLPWFSKFTFMDSHIIREIAQDKMKTLVVIMAMKFQLKVLVILVMLPKTAVKL